jgi:hypothetical protein
MTLIETKLKALGVSISLGLRKALWNKSFLEAHNFKPTGEIIVVQGGRVVHIHAPTRKGK